MKLSKLILFPALMVGFSVAAKTDVAGSVQLLKTNEENAKVNMKQYEENVDISSKNIAEVTAAIKQLREQKSQLTANSQNLDKNRAVLDQMKKKLEDYSATESALIKKEDGQIAELKATLEKLEANKVQRTENVATYQQKIADVEKEKADWSSQKQAFVQIQKEIDSKEAKAMTEREKWIGKRQGYRLESDKWKKEYDVAQQNRAKFEKLKN